MGYRIDVFTNDNEMHSFQAETKLGAFTELSRWALEWQKALADLIDKQNQPE